MISIARVIFLLLSLVSMQGMADAPVVDDSENFALLEEQPQAAEELPVAHESYNMQADDPEPRFTQSNTHNTAGNMELINKIQALQKDIQDLRGQLEIQAHELAELKQQQLSFYQDLDARLNQETPKIDDKTHTASTQHSDNLMQQATPDTKTTPPSKHTDKSLVTSEPNSKTLEANQPSNTVQTARSNPADEQISYLAAYELVKQKRFSPATIAMQQFLSKYPRGGYSANAHYWLGELYLSNKEYANAITQFDTVLQEFKSSSKYAPSRLKLGYALAESGRIGEAKEQLIAVMSLYPDTSAAHLAHVKLETLGR